MVVSCSVFDQEIPASAFDKCVSLYKLVCCMKCGDLSEDVYVNGECEHFVCHSCLKNVANFKVECRTVNACEGQNAKSCSKFFTSENMKPDLFLNKQAKLVLVAFDKHKISLKDVFDFVKKDETPKKDLERFQLDTQTPETEVTKEIDISSEEELPFLEKLRSPVAKLGNHQNEENKEAGADVDSSSLTSNEGVESRLLIDTDENSKLCIQNEEHAPLPKKFTIAEDSDSDISEYKTGANKTEKNIFDITISQPGSPSKDSKPKSRAAKNKSIASAHQFFNGKILNNAKVSPFKKPLKLPQCKPKMANDVTILKNSAEQNSKGPKSGKKGSAKNSFMAVSSSTSLTSFEVTSASSSGEDSVYGNVMKTARKALRSVENRSSVTLDESCTGNTEANEDTTLQDKSADFCYAKGIHSTGEEHKTPDKSIDATIRKLSKKNAQGETELHIESRKGHLERVKKLLEEGADPNTRDNINLRPLHEHKSLQNVEVCKLLLEYGAEPMVHGGERNVTPLHVAVQNDFIDAIPLLIQFGADIHAQAKTEDGRVYTPLSVAKVFEKTEIVELLESEAAKRDTETSLTNQPPGTPLRTPKLNLSEVLQHVESPKKDVISHFTTTSLDNIAIAGCSEFAKFFKLKMLPTYDKICDALVLAKKTDTKQYPRTAKVMLAILKNGILIDIDWVTDSTKAGRLLPNRPYLLNGLSGYFDSIKRARDASCENKKLFTGLKAYLKPGLSDAGLSNSDMKNLLISGGAKVLAREPKPETLHEVIDNASPDFISENSPVADLRVIIINSIKAFSNGKHFFRFAPGLYHVSFHWLVNSVCAFSIETASE